MEVKLDKSNWKKVKLGDVAFEYSKRVNNPSESGFDRFVGNSNIGQWDFRVKSWEPTSSVTSAMKLFESNDYLLVRRSLYASDFRERAPRAHFAGVCSGDILTIRENHEFIADGFLIGILNSPALWKFVVANASGSITRRIKWKDLSNYEFLLPPKDQQAELAELLWSMYGVIENKTSLQQQYLSLFNSWLNNTINSKQGWDSRPLASIAKVQTGVAKNKNIENQRDVIERPYLRVANVQDGYLDLEEIKNILIRSKDEERFSLQNGDLLLTEGGDFDKLGRGFVWQNEIPNCLHQNHVFAIRVDQDVISPWYLSLLTRSNFGKQYFLRCAKKTSNLASINSSQLKELRVLIPPKDLHLKIVNEMHSFYKLEKSISKDLDTSKNLQKSLISQVF